MKRRARELLHEAWTIASTPGTSERPKATKRSKDLHERIKQDLLAAWAIAKTLGDAQREDLKERIMQEVGRLLDERKRVQKAIEKVERRPGLFRPEPTLADQIIGRDEGAKSKAAGHKGGRKKGGGKKGKGKW